MLFRRKNAGAVSYCGGGPVWGKLKKKARKLKLRPGPGGVRLDGRAGYVIIIENPHDTTLKEV